MEHNTSPTDPPFAAQLPSSSLKQTEAPKPARDVSRKTLVLIIGVVVLLLVATGLGLYFVHRAQLVTEVKAVLSRVDNEMRGIGSDGAAFPQYIPSDISSDKVLLGGGGSFDGTTFCVTGTSKSDHSVVLHIASGDQGTIKEGDCPEQTPQNSALAAPNSLAIAAIESEVVSVTWQPVKGATGYTLECASNSEFSKDVTQTVSGTAQGFCTNLKGATTYLIRVAAKNDSKVSDWSGVITATTHDSSVAPDLTLALNKNSVNYSWTPVNGATQYILEWATDTSFMKNTQQKTLTATSGTVTGLLKGTVYYFHVKAVTAEFDANHATFSEPKDVLVSQ